MPLPGDDELLRIARHITHRIGSEHLGPGDLAALRRLDPEAPPRPFWMLWFEAWEGRETEPPCELERPFAVYARTVAELGGPGNGTLGHALAQLGDPAEPRLLRLLRLSGERLEHELRQLTHLLRSHDLRPDPADLLLLLVHPPDQPRGEAVRRRIARDFYAHLFQRERETAA